MQIIALSMDASLSQSDRFLFGIRLLRLGTAWRRELDHELRGFGLTGARWRPLFVLGLTSGPIRQSDIVRALDMDPPSLARLLEGLERDGLIERREDPTDRRSKLVGLTASGRTLHDQVTRVADAVGQRLLSGVPDGTLALCQEVFDRIERGLRPSERGYGTERRRDDS